MVYGTKVFLDGKDVTKMALQKVYDPNRKEAVTVKNVFPVKYSPEFIASLGLLLCPYHNYYYKKKMMLEQELKEYEEGNIRAQAVKKIEQELFELYKDETLKDKPKQLEERGGAFYSEAACRLIESIYTDKKDIQPVDTRNLGAITGLDEESVVETSCVITSDGPVPLAVGKLPIAVNGLIQQIKSFERLTIEAACEGSYEKGLLALCINPLTDDEKVAKVVFDELLEAHKEYLPLFFQKGGAPKCTL
jgi:6-phospho-beta-glucosidase